MVYVPTLRFGFVWDDQQLVLNNPQLKSGSVAPIFTGAFMPADSAKTEATGKYYRPLVGLSLLIDSRLHHLSPRGCHLHNILLHVAATLLFVLLVGFFTRSDWLRLLFGLLFALYPIHSESVAFVSARTDLLMTVFALATVLLGLGFRRQGRLTWLVLAAVAMLLALLAKETPILLPLACLPMVTREPAGRRRGWLLFGVLALVCAVYVVIRAQVLSGAVPVVNVMNPLQYGLMLLNIFGTYAAMLSYPFHQRVFLAQDPRLMQISLLTLFGVALLALPPLLVGSLRRQAVSTRTGNPALDADYSSSLLFGYLLLFASVLPVSNILSLGLAYAAERLAYLPSAGFLLIVAALAGWLLARTKRARALLTGVAACYLVAMPANLLHRLPVWRNQIALFRRMVSEAPGSASAHNNLGNAWLDDVRQPDSAAAEFRKALAIQGRDPELHALLARALKERHDTLGATAEYQEALRLRPDDFETQNNLGQLWGRRGGLDSAVAHLAVAVNLRPDRAEARSNLGIAYAMSGQSQAALAEFRQARQIDPGYREVLGNLGALFYDLGMRDSARYYLEQAKAAKP